MQTIKVTTESTANGCEFAAFGLNVEFANA